MHADNKPATTVPPGYRLVHLPSGGEVLVKDAGGVPTAQANQKPEKYSPTNLYNGSNDMADKSFAPSSNFFPQNTSYKSADQNGYLTKPYTASDSSSADHSIPNLNPKTSVASTSAYSRSATDFNKGFTTAKADIGKDGSSKFPTATASDQDHAAVLGGKTTDMYPSTFASKPYKGPETDDIKRDMAKINSGLMQVKDLPNRTLTFDEVRALLNHGFKPNTDEKPQPDNKPLNDPDYKPDVSPAPPSTPVEDDRNDPVPPPGTMSQPPPENTEALPQH